MSELFFPGEVACIIIFLIPIILSVRLMLPVLWMLLIIQEKDMDLIGLEVKWDNYQFLPELPPEAPL